MVALGKHQDLDKYWILCVYCWIEFWNFAIAVYTNSKTHLILEGFEDNHYNKDGSSTGVPRLHDFHFWFLIIL